jgi:hypothetical protein
LPDNESPSNYAANFDFFLRSLFCCGTGHPSGYTMPLTKVQREKANVLLKAIIQGQGDKKLLCHPFRKSITPSQPTTIVDEHYYDNKTNTLSWIDSVIAAGPPVVYSDVIKSNSEEA